uniref:Uncharacterized protein n=1 Tax=Arundo donax TaxID=35708 RepID=A0A0A9BNT2_ARUDO
MEWSKFKNAQHKHDTRNYIQQEYPWRLCPCGMCNINLMDGHCQI